VAVIESMVGAAAGWATRTAVKVGAVKVAGLKEFVAKSDIDPPLRSRVVLEIAIPSVSNSPDEVATVYLKSAVLLSVIDTKFAYFASEPTVNAIRGVPVTVTDSLKTIVNVGVSEGM
jgi:hypothetical protein